MIDDDEKPKHPVQLHFEFLKSSPKPTCEMREQMRKMYAEGKMQHDIAAFFRVNQGRVSEAVNSKD